jgi:hypothetical protein
VRRRQADQRTELRKADEEEMKILSTLESSRQKHRPMNTINIASNVFGFDDIQYEFERGQEVVWRSDGALVYNRRHQLAQRNLD